MNQLSSGAEQLKNFLPDGTQTTSDPRNQRQPHDGLDAAGKSDDTAIRWRPALGAASAVCQEPVVTTPGGLTSTVLSNRTLTALRPE